MIPGIGTIIGFGAGLLRDVVLRQADRLAKKQEIEFEARLLDIEKRRKEYELKDIKPERKTIADLISNCVICFVRPAISFFLLWFLFYIYKTSVAGNGELLPSFVEHILVFGETGISFWFYNRQGQKDKTKS